MSAGFNCALQKPMISTGQFESYMDTLCNLTGIPVADVLGHSRRQHVVDLRHVLMCVGRKEFGLSGNTVAEIMRKDRTLTIHASKRIKKVLEGTWKPKDNHLRECLENADDVYKQYSGHHFKILTKWLIAKK